MATCCLCAVFVVGSLGGERQWWVGVRREEDGDKGRRELAARRHWHARRQAG